MDTAEWLVTLGGVVLVALTLWFFFGKRRATPPPSATEELYACPMHPWITSPAAGTNCSVCGMMLVRQEQK